jgi:hypothetical protein
MEVFFVPFGMLVEVVPSADVKSGGLADHVKTSHVENENLLLSGRATMCGAILIDGTSDAASWHKE